MGALRHHSFLYRAQNNFTNRHLRLKRFYLFFNFDRSQIFLVKQFLHPFEKYCLWALMIAINVSVAICQLPIRQFCLFGKRSNRRFSKLTKFSANFHLANDWHALLSTNFNTLQTHLPRWSWGIVLAS